MGIRGRGRSHVMINDRGTGTAAGDSSAEKYDTVVRSDTISGEILLIKSKDMKTGYFAPLIILISQ